MAPTTFFSSVYILDESGPPHPAEFDADPGMGEAGDTDLTNGGWDPKDAADNELCQRPRHRRLRHIAKLRLGRHPVSPGPADRDE